MPRVFRLYASINHSNDGTGRRIAVMAETREWVCEALRRLGVPDPDPRASQRVTVSEGWDGHVAPTPIMARPRADGGDEVRTGTV